MQIKKKRNRIILCLCSIMLLIASIFAFIPINNESKTVYADTVTSDYSYNGSNISSNTLFTNGVFSKNLLQNTMNNVDLSSIYNLVIYEKKFDVTYPLLLYIKGIDVSEPVNPTAGFLKFEYTDGTIGYKLAEFNNQVLTYGFSGAKILQRITIINYSACTGTIEFAQLEYGSTFTGYVPSYDSTVLNYEFDFTTSMNFDTNLTNINLTCNISNQFDYTLVSNIDHSYNYGNTFRFSTNVKGIIDSITFSAYNKETNVLNNDYIFELYVMVDYFDDENYNPATFFTANITSIVLGSYLDYSSYFKNDYLDIRNFLSTQKYNFISYVDENNNNLNIFIPLDSNISSDYWQFRTYYTSTLSDTSVAYNNGYLNGYNKGYGAGDSDGYKNGYNKGYSTGKNDGYNLGYNTALENDRYTFTALISSVIDVPIKAFTSLFNFEVLGVNLAGFFLGLLTCCIVIGVIRLIL